jgi:Nif-specific regulatory protein
MILDEPNVARVQEALVAAVVRICHAERGFLVLFGDTHDDAFVLATAGIDDVEAPSQRFFRHCAFKAAATGQLVLTADARVDAETKQRAHVVGLGLRSILAAPVIPPDGCRGALYIDHTFQVGCFAAQQVELIEALADLCALSVGRSALESAIHQKQGVSPGMPQRQFLAAKASLERPGPVSFGRTGGGLVGRSKSMRRAVEALERVAPLAISVLIEGPAGVGKGIAARALHDKSGRRKLTVCDLRELPADSIESELFGHEKGAFKGARSARKGLLLAAHKGTLLLEHLDDVSVEVQAKLVRALEDGTVRPIGAEGDVVFDVRVVATVRANVAERVRDGTFREDLFVLVSGVHVELEPLDLRPEDKGSLIDAFLQSYRSERPPTLTPEARAALETRRYPGDARELIAVLVAAASLAEDDPIGLDELPRVRSREAVPLREALKAFESGAVKRALKANRSDLTKTAKELGISRRALKRKLAQFDLEV